MKLKNGIPSFFSETKFKLFLDKEEDICIRELSDTEIQQGFTVREISREQVKSVALYQITHQNENGKITSYAHIAFNSPLTREVYADILYRYNNQEYLGYLEGESYSPPIDIDVFFKKQQDDKKLLENLANLTLNN